jgi:hypothetical protein
LSLIGQIFGTDFYVAYVSGQLCSIPCTVLYWPMLSEFDLRALGVCVSTFLDNVNFDSYNLCTTKGFFCEKRSQKLAFSMTRPSCADPFSVQV